MVKAKQTQNAKRKKAAAKKPVVTPAVVNVPTKKPGNFKKIYKGYKQSGWQKTVTYLKKRPVLMFLIPFLVLGAGFVAYNQYQIYQEKQDFEQAELVLDDLSNQIADSLGKPIKVEKEKSCGYSSEKFGKGDLGCGVTIKSIYAPNYDDTSRYIQYIELIDKMKNYSKDNMYYNSNDEYSYTIKNDLGMNCSLTMRLNNEFADSSLGCNKYAQREYFPVIE